MVVAVVAVVLFLIAGVAVLPLSYNLLGPVRDRRLLKKSDRTFLDHYCKEGALTRYRRVNRRLPANPRCKLCYVPFGGLGHVLGIRPSRKNSNFCRGCFEAAPLGGYETVIGVLFADARGFTAWAESRSPTDVAAALDRFYRGAMKALMAHDAVVDKFVGDEVMALFISELPSLGAHTCDEMLAAAREIVSAAASSFSELGIGIGLHFGTAWLGNVGAGEMKEFTALGDVVNVASRLQGCAGSGEIVMSDAVFSRLSTPLDATAKEFHLKGKAEALHAHVAAPTAGVSS